MTSPSHPTSSDSSPAAAAMAATPPPAPSTISLRLPSRLLLSKPDTTTSSPPGSSSIPLPTPTQLHGTWHVTHSTLPLWKNKRNVQITYGPVPSSSGGFFSSVFASSSSADSSHTDSSHNVPTHHSTTASNGNDITTAMISDLVQYQSLTSSKTHSITGIDTPGHLAGTFTWRGKGLLALTTSEWEIMGWGRLPRKESAQPERILESREENGGGLGREEVGGGGDVDGDMNGVVIENNMREQGGGEEEDEFIITYFAKTLFTPAGIDFYSRHRRGLSEGTVRKLREELEQLDERGRREGKEAEKGEVGRLMAGLFEVRMDEDGDEVGK